MASQKSATPPGDFEKPLDRAYIVLKAGPELSELQTLDKGAARGDAASVIRRRVAPLAEVPFTVVDTPGLRTSKSREAARALAEEQPLIVAIALRRQDTGIIEKMSENPEAYDVLDAGADAAVEVSAEGCPAVQDGAPFADQAAAHALIGAGALQQMGLTGNGVNVVLFDSGLDSVERASLGLTIASEWHSALAQSYDSQKVPSISRYDHAFMIARQLKALAPDIQLHDYRILPPRLSRSFIPSMSVRGPAFISTVIAAYEEAIWLVRTARAAGNNQPWVFVNAWSIFRRSWPIGTQLDRRQSYLNRLIDKAVNLGVDVIFGAGNCGSFFPDLRCGKWDRGQGASIVGPNGHPAVLTVGAVRCDAEWPGYSSQGPGIMGNQPNAIEKPDLCAPSGFRDPGDGGRINGGTSAACAVTAAAVAALRQNWPALSPDQLKAALIATARGNGQWSDRLGFGILNLDAAINQLNATSSA